MMLKGAGFHQVAMQCGYAAGAKTDDPEAEWIFIAKR
jgi:hypothetical protein